MSEFDVVPALAVVSEVDWAPDVVEVVEVDGSVADGSESWAPVDSGSPGELEFVVESVDPGAWPVLAVVSWISSVVPSIGVGKQLNSAALMRRDRRTMD